MDDQKTNQSGLVEDIAKQVGLSKDFKQNIQKLQSVVSGNGGSQFGHNQLAILANEFLKNPNLASKYGFSKDAASRLLGWSMRIRKDNVKAYPQNIGAGGFLYGSPQEALASKKSRRDFVSSALKDIETARFGPSGTETIPQQVGDFFKGAGSGFFAAENMLNAEQSGTPFTKFTPREYSPTSRLGYEFGAGLSDTLPSHIAGLAGGATFGTIAGNAAEAATSLLPQTRALRGIGIGVKALAPIVSGFIGAGKGAEAIQPFTPLGKLSEAGQQEYLSDTQGPGRKLGETAAFLSTASAMSKDPYGRPVFFSGGLRNAIGALRSGKPVSSPEVLPPLLDIGNRAFLVSHGISTADNSNKIIRENFKKQFGREPTISELESIPGYQTQKDKLASAASLALLGHMNPLGNIATGHVFRDIGSALQGTRFPKVRDSRKQPSPFIAPPIGGEESIPVSPSGFTGDPNMLRMDIRSYSDNPEKVADSTKTVYWNPRTLESRFGEKRGITPDFVTKHNEWFASSKDNAPAISEGGVTRKIIGMSSDGEYFVSHDNGKSRVIDAVPYRELPEPLKAVAETARQKSIINRSIISPEEITGRVREYNPESDANENFGEFFKYKIPFAKVVEGKPKLVEVFAHIESINNKNKSAKVLLPSGNRMEVPLEFIKDPFNVGIAESDFRFPSKSANVYRYANFAAQEGYDSGLLISSKDPVKTTKRLMKGVDLTPEQTRERYIGRSDDEFTLEPGTLVDLGVLRQIKREGINVDSERVRQHIGVVVGVDTVDIDGQSGMGYRIRMLTDPTANEFLAAPEFISKATKSDIENAQQGNVSEARVRRTQLQQENEQSSQEIADLKKQIEDITKQLEEQQNKPTVDPEEITKLQQQIADKDQQIKDNEQIVSENNAKLAEAQAKFEDLSTKLKNNEITDEQFKKQQAALKGQITKLENAVKKATEISDNQTKEIELLRTQLAEKAQITPEQRAELEQQISELNSRISELQSTIEEKNTQIEELGRRGTGTGSGDEAGSGDSNIGTNTQRKPPPDVDFPYGVKYGEIIDDEYLPEELRSSTRGEQFRFYAQTLGDEFNRQGDIENIPSAFRTLIHRISGAVDFRGENFSFESVANAKEFEAKLVKVFGQTPDQARVLARWVDAKATGWAHEVARLSGINTKLRVMALRTPEEMNRTASFKDNDAWKALYREQVITSPSKEILDLLSKLKAHWYTHRFGAIVTLTPEQLNNMRIPINSPGFTQSFGQDGHQTVNIAFALRGPEQYGVHVHEINHLITRAMYAPMYHELVSVIYPSLNSKNTTFSRRGQEQIDIDGVKINKGQLVEIPKFVEEQIVTALTRQLWEAGSDTSVRPLNEMFAEGGAVHDSVMSRIWHDVGQQLRDAAAMPSAPEATNLDTMTGWAVKFDRSANYKIGTPLIYTDPNSGVRTQYRLIQNSRLNKDGKITTINVSDESGTKQSFAITDAVVGNGQWRVGQMNTTISNDVRGMHIIGKDASKVIAKFLGHWLDHTNEMLSKYSAGYETKPIENVFTAQDLIRRTTGTQWWANESDYNAQRRANKLQPLDVGRIRGRTSKSYLGWLDIGDEKTKSGYDVFLPYETIVKIEKELAQANAELNNEVTEEINTPDEIRPTNTTPDDSGIDNDIAELLMISSEPKQDSDVVASSQSEFGQKHYNKIQNMFDDLMKLTEKEYFSTTSRPYETLIHAILHGAENDNVYRGIIYSVIKEKFAKDLELKRKIQSRVEMSGQWRGVFNEYAYAGLSQLFRNIRPTKITGSKEILRIPRVPFKPEELRFVAYVKTEKGIVRKYISKEQLWNEIKATLNRSAKLAADSITIEERGRPANRSNPYYSFDQSYSNDKGILDILNDIAGTTVNAGKLHSGGSLEVDLSRLTEIARKSIYLKEWQKISGDTGKNNRGNKTPIVYIDDLIKSKTLSDEQKALLDEYGLTEEAIAWFKTNGEESFANKEITFEPSLRGIPAMSLYTNDTFGVIGYEPNKGWFIANIKRSLFSQTEEATTKKKIEEAFEKQVKDAVSLSDDELKGFDPVDEKIMSRPESIISSVFRQETSEQVVESVVNGLDNVDFNKSEFMLLYDQSRELSAGSVIDGIPEFIDVKIGPVDLRTMTYMQADVIMQSAKNAELQKKWSDFKFALTKYVTDSVAKTKSVFEFYKLVSDSDTYGKYDRKSQSKALVQLLKDINEGRIDLSLFDSTTENKPVQIILDRLIKTNELVSDVNYSDIQSRIETLADHLKMLVESKATIKSEIEKIDVLLSKNMKARQSLPRNASKETKAIYNKTESELRDRRRQLSTMINSDQRWNDRISTIERLLATFDARKYSEFQDRSKAIFDGLKNKLNSISVDIDRTSEIANLAKDPDFDSFSPERKAAIDLAKSRIKSLQTEYQEIEKRLAAIGKFIVSDDTYAKIKGIKKEIEDAELGIKHNTRVLENLKNKNLPESNKEIKAAKDAIKSFETEKSNAQKTLEPLQAIVDEATKNQQNYKLTIAEQAEKDALVRELEQVKIKKAAGEEHPDLQRQRQTQIAVLKRQIADLQARSKQITDLVTIAKENNLSIDSLQDARSRILSMLNQSSKESVSLLMAMKKASLASKTPMSDMDFNDGVIGLGRSYSYQNKIVQRAKQMSEYRKTPYYFEFLPTLTSKESSWLENYFWLRQSRRSIVPGSDTDNQIGASNKSIASRLMRVGDQEFESIARSVIQKLNAFENSKRAVAINKLRGQGQRINTAIDFLIQFSKDGAGIGTPKWMEQIKGSHYMSDAELATYVLSSLDKQFIDGFKYGVSDKRVKQNYAINDESIRVKIIERLKEILGDTEEYTENQSTSIVRQLKQSLDDMSILPYGFTYSSKRSGRQVTIKTEADFDRSPAIHAALKKGFQHGLLDTVDTDKPITYAALIARLKDNGFTTKNKTGQMIILSDTEIANIITLSANEKYPSSEEGRLISALRFIELTRSRDEAVKNPLSEQLGVEQKALTGITIENINEMFRTDPVMQTWSPYDKIGALGVLGRVISDERNIVTKFIQYTGQLPTPSDLTLLAEKNKTPIQTLEKQLEGVKTVISNISIEAFASGMTGTQIEMSANKENAAMSFFTYGLTKSPNEMFIDQGNAQSQILTQVDTLFEKSILTALGKDASDISKEELDSIKTKLSAIYLPDVVFGMPYRQKQEGVVIPKTPAPSSRQSTYTTKSDLRTATYSFQFAEHVRRTTVNAVETAINILSGLDTDGSIQRGKGSFLFGNRGNISTISTNIKAIKGGTVSQRNTLELALTQLSTRIAEQIIAQRMEIVKALENHSLDSYVYRYDTSTNLVNVYDYAQSKSEVIYTIDYANARVRDKNGKIILAENTEFKTFEFEGEEYPFTQAQQSMTAILSISGMPIPDARKLVVLTSDKLKSVPAVYYHGIDRVNNVPDNIPEPMFLSSEKQATEIEKTVGVFDTDVHNAYVLPVIRSWKSRGRILVNDSGLPFYDGLGYTVQDQRGFRSGIFANLRGAGFSIDKSLEIYALTEHPLFRTWMKGDLIETPKMNNVSSYLDQKRVMNTDTYFKTMNGMRIFDAINAIDEYTQNPTDEAFDNFKFAFEQVKEIHTGFGDDYKAFDKMFDEIKSDKNKDLRVQSFRPILQSFMDKEYTNNTRPIIAPYMNKVMAQVEIKTGKPFTTLAFDNLDPNMYSMTTDGVKAFDLGSGLYINANRNNTPRFIRFANPLVIDGKNSTVDVFELKKAFDTAIKNGRDGIVLLNIRDDFNEVTRKTLAFTLDDSNILDVQNIAYPKTEGSKAKIQDIEPMFISSIPSNFTQKYVPAATGTKTVSVEPTLKEKLIKFAENIYDNDQDLTRFSLSQDIAVTAIQGGKAALGSLIPFAKAAGRHKDTAIAMHAFAKSMVGMAPNLRIEITLPDGSQIPIGWDKLGRRQYMLMYKTMSADPFFQVLRDSDAPLHFIGLERKVEKERMRIYNEAGGKLKYQDINIDLMDFDEQGNLPDFYERKTILSHLPMRGMHERQMSLQHDLLMFGLLKNQYEINPMFNKLTPSQLSRDVAWNSFVKFMGLSQGDLRFSSNDIQDMHRGRIAKLFFQAPRWFLGNIIANPLINVALYMAYKHSPAVRKKLGKDPQAIWFNEEILKNKQAVAYIAHDTIGTMLTMSLMPVFWQIMGQILQRDDISKTKGNITGWRLGDWTFSESTGTMDLPQWLMRLNEAMDAGSYKSSGKYGMTQEEYNHQQMLRWANVVLYKSSPFLNKKIAFLTGVDFLGRPSWARNEAVRQTYIENMEMINSVLHLYPEGQIPELPIQSNFATQFGLSYLNDYAEAYYKARKFRTSDPAVANLIAAQQMIMSYVGLRARYEPFQSEEYKKTYRKFLFKDFKERTEPVEFDWSFNTILKGK